MCPSVLISAGVAVHAKEVVVQQEKVVLANGGLGVAASEKWVGGW